jgi:signal transduction histidine kinase/ligand-binding sensor domain-containing protein
MFKKIYIPILIFTLQFQVSAQGADIRFEHLTSEQGLSQNSVLCIIQDQQGFLWLGTEDGLNKYDGYKFTVYRYEPQDTNSLSDSYITALCEDLDGNLWIGTKEGGLNKYDPRTGRIQNWKHQPENRNSLSSNYVLSVYIDKSGTLWCGTYGGGLNKFDKDKCIFECWKSDPNNPTSISNDYIYDIVEDFKGNLWLATYHGLCRLSPEGRESGTFNCYFSEPKNPLSISSNRVWSLFETKHPGDTVLWIGTQCGLNLYQHETDNFLHYYPNPQNLDHFNNSINSIILTSTGPRESLWLGTYNGLFQLNISDMDGKLKRSGLTFTGYFHQIIEPFSLSENVISSLYQDKSDIFWIGTYGGGINKYSVKKHKFKRWTKEAGNPNSLSNKGVWAISETYEGVIWIGTTEGLNLLHLKTGKIKHFFHQPENPNSIGHDYINAICTGENGELWLGTHGGGLTKISWDKNNKPQFEHWKEDLNKPGGLTHNFILTIYQDKSGLIWIGTWGGGLNQLNPRTNKIQYWVNNPDDPNSLSFDGVWCIYEDRQGNLWIGTYGGGLNLFNRENGTFQHWQHDVNDTNSLSHNIVYTIYQPRNGPAGTLWIGTGGGLNKMEMIPNQGSSEFEISEVKFTYYLQKDGLPNNVVYGILEDQHGNLWLSTNGGLSRFNPKTETFKNYDIHDGLQSNEFNSGAYFKSTSGLMFFGGVNGLNAFYPDSLKDNSYKPAIVLTDFRIFNQPVPVGGDSPLQVPITETQEITLSYKQNIFSFEFSALDFTAPQKNRYAYKMEGFEDPWNYLTDRRFASYTGLPSGEYIFRVIGSNNDGIWNREGTAVKILIKPPPWKTWWAYTIYTLIIVGAITGWRWNDLNKRKRKIEEHLRQEREEAELREAKLRAESAEFKAKVLLTEQELEKQQIRNRIASDLHDEIGSNLSSIKLISEILQTRLNLDKESQQYFADIYQAANASSESMRDIVWFINPGSDHLNKLIARMKETANTMLKNIKFTLHGSGLDAEQKINPEIRRNIFLIYKEILNNIIKHSEAKRVDINISQERGNLHLSIRDNGKGFDCEKEQTGQGLKNMRNRVSQMDGNLKIESRPGQGTRITVKVKMA